MRTGSARARAVGTAQRCQSPAAGTFAVHCTGPTPGPLYLCTVAACDEATVSFGSTEVCAEFATGQRAIFAAGSGTAVEGKIVLAVPFTASPLLQNTAAAAGKIVVIEQGGSALGDRPHRRKRRGQWA